MIGRYSLKAETIQQLIDWEPPKVREIIGDGILWPGTKGLIYGQFGTWKSMIAMHTGYCLTTGRNWFGHQVNRCPTLMLQMEIPKMLFRERHKKYLLGNKLLAPPDLWTVTDHSLTLDRGFGIQGVESLLAALRPQVLIIDPIYKIMQGNINENDQVKPVLDLFDRWISTYHLSVLLIGHPRKPSKEELNHEIDFQGYELMGASFWANWFDTMARVTPVPGSKNHILMEFNKVRNAQIEIPSVLVTIDRNTLTFTHKTAETREE